MTLHRNNNRKKKIFQAAISVAILGYLLSGIDLASLKTTIAKANYHFIIILLILPFANRILMPFKWNLLLRFQKIRIPLWRIIKIYYISSFLGIFLPPTIGADALRAYYINHDTNRLPDIISSIVIERVIGLLALVTSGVIGGIIFLNFFLFECFDIQKFFIFSSIFAILVFGTFAISFTDFFSCFIFMVFDRCSNHKRAGKFVIYLSKFYHSYLNYRRNKTVLFAFFSLTLLEIALKVIRTYCIGIALNIHVPVAYYFSFVPIILFLVRLPISLNGFGVHEGGFVYFLGLIGISDALSFSIGFIDHLILIYAVLPGGLFYIFDKSKSGNTPNRNDMRKVL